MRTTYCLRQVAQEQIVGCPLSISSATPLVLSKPKIAVPNLQGGWDEKNEKKAGANGGWGKEHTSCCQTETVMLVVFWSKSGTLLVEAVANSLAMGLVEETASAARMLPVARCLTTSNKKLLV